MADTGWSFADAPVAPKGTWSFADEPVEAKLSSPKPSVVLAPLDYQIQTEEAPRPRPAQQGIISVIPPLQSKAIEQRAFPPHESVNLLTTPPDFVTEAADQLATTLGNVPGVREVIRSSAGLASPLNLATMATMGPVLSAAAKVPALAPALGTLMAGYFGTEAGKQFLEASHERKAAWQKGDYAGVADALGKEFTAAVFAGLGAKGAIEGARGANVEVEQAVQRHNETAAQLGAVEGQRPTVTDETPVMGMTQPMAVRTSVVVKGYDAKGNPRGEIVKQVVNPETETILHSGDESSVNDFLARQKQMGELAGTTPEKTPGWSFASEPIPSEPAPAATETKPAAPDTYDTPEGTLTVTRRYTTPKGVATVIYERNGRRGVLPADKFQEMVAKPPETLDVSGVQPVAAAEVPAELPTKPASAESPAPPVQILEVAGEPVAAKPTMVGIEKSPMVESVTEDPYIRDETGKPLMKKGTEAPEDIATEASPQPEPPVVAPGKTSGTPDNAPTSAAPPSNIPVEVHGTDHEVPPVAGKPASVLRDKIGISQNRGAPAEDTQVAGRSTANAAETSNVPRETSPQMVQAPQEQPTTAKETKATAAKETSAVGKGGFSGQLFRGTEKDTQGRELRESPVGELGRGSYVTQHKWLAATYGGGPTANVKAGTREVHKFDLAKDLEPKEVAYLGGGSSGETDAVLTSGDGAELWRGKLSGKKADRERTDEMNQAARKAGAKIIIGGKDSVALNQVVILDKSAVKAPERLSAEEALRKEPKLAHEKVVGLQYSPHSKVLVAWDSKGDDILRERVEPNRLDDYIGNDVAKDLLAQPTDKGEDDEWDGYHILKGEDLTKPRLKLVPREEAVVEAPHKLSSTQVNLDKGLSQKIKAFGDKIPKDLLAEDGLEEKHHATVFYGLHTKDAAEVQKIIEGHGPVTAQIKGTSIFPASKEHDYDVVKLDIDSPDLAKLNAKIKAALPNTTTFPKYVPHITIGYLKAGEGRKYAGRGIPGVSGQTVTFDTVNFSPSEGEKTDISLKAPEKAESAPSTEVIKVIKGDDVEVHVAKIDNGYSVGIFDSDEQKALGELKIYRDRDLALQYAHKIAKKPAAEPAKAPEKKSLGPEKKAAKPNPAVEWRREFYTPGNVIFSGYWKKYDKVLAYDEKPDGLWSVKVQTVKEDGTPMPGEPIRTHSTPPDKGSRIVSKFTSAKQSKDIDTALADRAKAHSEVVRLEQQRKNIGTLPAKSVPAERVRIGEEKRAAEEKLREAQGNVEKAIKKQPEWLSVGRSVGTFEPNNTDTVKKLASETGDAVALNQWNTAKEGVPDSYAVFERLMSGVRLPKHEFTDREWQDQFEAYKKAFKETLSEYAHANKFPEGSVVEAKSPVTEEWERGTVSRVYGTGKIGVSFGGAPYLFEANQLRPVTGDIAGPPIEKIDISAQRFDELYREIEAARKNPLYSAGTHEGMQFRDKVLDMENELEEHRPAAVAKAQAEIDKEQGKGPALKTLPADVEEKFAAEFKEKITQSKKQSQLDFDEAEVKKTIDKLTQPPGDGNGAQVGKRQAIIHRKTEVVWRGKNKETIARYTAIVSDPRHASETQTFNELKDAAYWATDMLYGLGREGGGFQRWGGGGSPAKTLANTGSLISLGNMDMAASDAAAKAIGHPELAGDIYHNAMSGGWAKITRESTFADVAKLYADSLPRNETPLTQHGPSKTRYGNQGAHENLVADKNPTKGTESWDFQLENYERTAKGMADALKTIRARIATAKVLNGGTTPRIEESEKFYDKAEQNIAKNLEYVKEQAKAETAKELAEITPKAKQVAEAYAKYGTAAFKEKYSHTENPLSIRDRYAKLAGVEGGWAGIMKALGVAEEKPPKTINIPIGRDKLVKAELEAIKEIDLDGDGGFVPLDARERFQKRGWLDEEGKLTELGRRAVYTLRQDSERQSEGKPISEYRPANRPLPGMGETRYGSEKSAWNLVNGDVWFTEGHGAWKGEPPPNWAPRDKATPGPDVARVIPQKKGEDTQPIGFYTAQAKDGPATYIVFDNGAAMNQTFYDYTTKRYGELKWTRERGNHAFQAWNKAGDRVAVVMPLRLDGVPANLKSLVKEETAEDTSVKRNEGERGSAKLDFLSYGLGAVHEAFTKPKLDASAIKSLESKGETGAELHDTLRQAFQSANTEDRKALAAVLKDKIAPLVPAEVKELADILAERAYETLPKIWEIHDVIKEIIEKAEERRVPFAGIAEPGVDPEIKKSTLARKVDEQAVANKLTEGFADLPEYKTINIARQATMAQELLRNDLDAAIRVAMGQEIPPHGLLPESVFVAVENYATESRDVDLLQRLATASTLSLEATGMGQRIRMLGERNQNSAVASMQKVIEAREQAAEKRQGKGAKERIKKEIKEEIKKEQGKKDVWQKFISELTCR